VGIQRGGGYIGKRIVPTAISASGVWSITEVESAARDSIWPASAITSPSAISGLQLWLDGSDAGTLYDATSGGSLAAADGAVARWEDKSGNARHFTQGTSGVQPLRKTSVKNGLSAVEFTGDWMSGTYTYTIGTIFVVWNQPTTRTDFTSVVSARTSSASKVASGSLNYNLNFPSVDAVAVDSSPGSVTAVAYRLNRVAITSANFINFNAGVSARTSPDRWQHTSASFAAVAGSKPFVLGADSFGATGRTMNNGHIGEMIAYSGTLTAGQVLSVEQYLINKWGLS
jgi:hypothetical protein